MVQGLEEIHSLIRKTRKDRHISQQALGSVICSVQQVSKIEKGDVSPDFFLTEIFLQRLGMASDIFEIVLSLEEYEEIEARDDIIDDLRQGRLAEAARRLETFCADAGEDQPIRRMNRYRFLGVLALEQGEYENAEKDLAEAVRLTMGKVDRIVLQERLLAAIELETLILYAQALRMCGKTSQAGELLGKVSDHVRERITDSREQARFLSKIAVVQGGICKEAGEYEACADLCGEALELLRDNNLTQCMPSLLGLLGEASERIGQREKAERLRHWREAIEQLYAHFGLDASVVDKLYFNACTSQYYLIGEIIREERRTLGLSQEELIEGIYQESATLSRVENGQMPDKKKLAQLMERLGMSGCRYVGAVATEDYRVLEMNYEIDKLLDRHEEERAAWATEQMRRYVDLSIPKNRQRVEGLELSYQLQKGELEREEVYRRAESLLRLTYREGTERPPFRKELYLINLMCTSLYRMGRREEAVSEYQRVWERFERSRVRGKYHFLSEGMILDNMPLYLFYCGCMEETEEWSELSARQQLLNGKINGIHYALSNFIGILEDRAERQAGGPVDFKAVGTDFADSGAREKCLRYMDWAVATTDIFKQKIMHDRLIRFGKENLGMSFKED